MSREPVFGPNTKPMLVQTVIGIAIVVLLTVFVGPWVKPAIARFTCTYITGSCLPDRASAAPASPAPGSRSP